MRGVTEKDFSLNELNAFSGLEKSLSYPLPGLAITQGICYLVERTQIDWLLTDIAYQHLPRVLALYPDTF